MALNLSAHEVPAQPDNHRMAEHPLWEKIPGFMAVGLGFAAIHLIWQAGRVPEDPTYQHIKRADPDHFIPGLNKHE